MGCSSREREKIRRKGYGPWERWLGRFRNWVGSTELVQQKEYKTLFFRVFQFNFLSPSSLLSENPSFPSEVLETKHKNSNEPSWLWRGGRRPKGLRCRAVAKENCFFFKISWFFKQSFSSYFSKINLVFKKKNLSHARSRFQVTK